MLTSERVYIQKRIQNSLSLTFGCHSNFTDKDDANVNQDSVKAEDKMDSLDKDTGSLVGEDGKSDDFMETDRDRVVREQERRFANNARER